MTESAWKNRIVGYGAEAPAQLVANPRNWRVHPSHQQAALAGSLSELGWIQNVIVNQRTGYVLDGHARVALALRENQTDVPVTYVDLSDAEEALVLATLDPISAMAGANTDQLDALLREVSTGETALAELISDLAVRSGVLPPDTFDPAEHWQGMPEFEQDNLGAVKQLTVSFASAADVAEFARTIGQNVTMETRSIWFPAVARERLIDHIYVAEDDTDAA